MPAVALLQSRSSCVDSGVGRVIILTLFCDFFATHERVISWHRATRSAGGTRLQTPAGEGRALSIHEEELLRGLENEAFGTGNSSDSLVKNARLVRRSAVEGRALPIVQKCSSAASKRRDQYRNRYDSLVKNARLVCRSAVVGNRTSSIRLPCR